MRLLDLTRLSSILLVIAAGAAFAADPPAPDTPEAGLAARGWSLPNDIPVEVEAIFEILPE
jgi:hypothetical protein